MTSVEVHEDPVLIKYGGTAERTAGPAMAWSAYAPVGLTSASLERKRAVGWAPLIVGHLAFSGIEHNTGGNQEPQHKKRHPCAGIGELRTLFFSAKRGDVRGVRGYARKT